MLRAAANLRRCAVVCAGREADAAPFRGGRRRHELANCLKDRLELLVVLAKFPLTLVELAGPRSLCVARISRKRTNARMMAMLT